MLLKNNNIIKSDLLKNVSRETLEKLELYSTMLKQWNEKINLISQKDVDQIWDRHIIDSLQLSSLIDSSVQSMADFGSGGGFPGLVLSIVTGLPIFLVESDVRKAVFLREVVRQTQSQAIVLNQRIENTKMPLVDMITARALSSLKQLLFFSDGKLQKNGYCLFLKGRKIDMEIKEAQEFWQVDYEKIPSKTSADGVILKINQFERIV